MDEKTTAAGPTSTPQRDEAARALKTSVTREIHDLTGEAKHLAESVAGEATKAAESTLSAGKKRAVEGLGGVAQAIRKTGEQLRAEDQGAFTEYFDGAARQVDAASRYLQRRTFGQIVGDVEQFARREPALFLGGAFVAGLVGGRFLKSSRSTPAAMTNVGASQGGSGHRRERAQSAAGGSTTDRGRETGGGAQQHPGAASTPAGGAQRGDTSRGASPRGARTNASSSSGSSPAPKEAGNGTKFSGST